MNARMHGQLAHSTDPVTMLPYDARTHTLLSAKTREGHNPPPRALLLRFTRKNHHGSTGTAWYPCTLSLFVCQPHLVAVLACLLLLLRLELLHRLAQLTANHCVHVHVLVDASVDARELPHREVVVLHVGDALGETHLLQPRIHVRNPLHFHERHSHRVDSCRNAHLHVFWITVKFCDL
eukprot:GDKI01006016.1.p1 GENE.GDKI01006016.1~~GDKI01006016.1.p1  ORF type:complete len:179 (+),score=15.70 GDKI01006016.1:153-689(+)